MNTIDDEPTPRREVITQLYAQFKEDLRRARHDQREIYAHFRGYPMFGDIEGEWLYLFTRKLNETGPVRVLEIGSGCGWSTSWILQGLKDTGRGHLTSVDIRATTDQNLPPRLTRSRWTFLREDVLTCLDDLPKNVDVLLIDSCHDSPMVEQIHAALLPRCRPGGITCVHDIYMLPHPRHSEALAIFSYLDTLGVRPFTPSPQFPEYWDLLSAVREACALGENIHINEINSSLWFQVPEGEEAL